VFTARYGLSVYVQLGLISVFRVLVGILTASNGANIIYHILHKTLAS
jgi:hypothetical protein